MSDESDVIPFGAASGPGRDGLKDQKGGEALGGWFLGPKAENAELFKRLIDKVLDEHFEDRKRDYPEDPLWITDERKQAESYRRSVKLLEEQLDKLISDLAESVPFFSYRYQGHMLWDVTMPAVLGYMAALLYNQNNVAAEASPVTTRLEMEVGDDLCRMLGYRTDNPSADSASGEPRAWGHITCDGSVANSEAVWCARNLKYYPLGVAAALRIEPALQSAQGLDIRLPTGEVGILSELEPWQLLNLEVDEVLQIPGRLTDEYQLTGIEKILVRYSVQDLGLVPFLRRFAPRSSDPVILTPATAHYSWPKAAAMMGLGRSALQAIQVDLDGRMQLSELRRALDTCLRNRQPVVMVVAVLGTTQESAVDPLADILKLRDRYRKKGLEFWLHVDGAWGGYFASMLRTGMVRLIPATRLSDASEEEKKRLMAEAGWFDNNQRFFRAAISMPEYVEAQYKVLGEADSITVDPHKAGYIPYPAGGLCYRNSALRNLVSFKSPVVFKGDADPTVGLYGIEGSKPGAAAAATYLSHRVIRPDKTGYGRILSRCMWNSKLFYANLVTMAQEGDPFLVVPFQRLPVQRQPDWTDAQVREELGKIRTEVVDKSDEELTVRLEEDEEFRNWFRNMGSDQIIVAYAFNFRANGLPNERLEPANCLNRRIFGRLSRLKTSKGETLPPLFVTSSAYDPATYGTRTVSLFKRRLGIRDDSSTPVDFLISTTMDPWLSDTAEGNVIPMLISKMREVVLEEVADQMAAIDDAPVA